MNPNHNIASTRTAINTAWVLSLVGLICQWQDWKVDLTDPATIALVTGALAAFHRVTTVLAEHVPIIGLIVFGVNKSPGYAAPPPAVPIVAEPAPQLPPPPKEG